MTKELKGLRTDINNKRDEVKEPVSVPNRIRNAVKEYFANGEEMELKWDYKKRFFDEVNSEFTDYIKRSVRGVAPDVTNEVLDTAVKRYFTSKWKLLTENQEIKKHYISRSRPHTRGRKRRYDAELRLLRKRTGQQRRRTWF